MQLREIFEARIAVAELRENADSSLLDPAEAAVCVGFAPKRLADFTAGRLCARRALADLAITDFPLLVGADRCPVWPHGIRGSISHTAGFCCAVAAFESAVGSIGVDAEHVGRVTADLDALVFTARESAYLASLDATARARAATIIFSAKEAFYKCQHGVTKEWLDFTDASLELTSSDELSSGTFVVDVDYERLGLADRIVRPLSGRFIIVENIAITGITL